MLLFLRDLQANKVVLFISDQLHMKVENEAKFDIQKLTNNVLRSDLNNFLQSMFSKKNVKVILNRENWRNLN